MEPRPEGRGLMYRATMSSETSTPPLVSVVVTSPADTLLAQAIASTLQAALSARVALFEQLVNEIQAFMAARPHERPWTCTFFDGTDGSRIFRGGVGHSLVIDPAGRLWRARSYEDFITTYTLTATTCDIATLTPLYIQMREYLPHTESAAALAPIEMTKPRSESAVGE